LIAAGYFDSIGGIAASSIAAWNGSSWSALGSGIGKDTSDSRWGVVYALAVFNGELYAGGIFDTAGGVLVNNIAKWNGSTWSVAGSGILMNSFAEQTVSALAAYNGSLYAGGSFDTAGGIAAHSIAQWNGSSWSDVGGGVRLSLGGSGLVHYLGVINNKLYAGGLFDTVGNAVGNNIATWDGSSWSVLGRGVIPFASFPYGIFSIALYNGYIYAGGTGSDGVNLNGDYEIARWNDTTWSYITGAPTDPLISTFPGYIRSLFVFDNKLIAGGCFTSISDTLYPGNDTVIYVNASSIAQWNGTNWSNLGTGLYGLAYPAGYGFTYAMDTFNGHLVVGGQFYGIDSVAAFDIAEYTCTTTGIQNISSSKVNLYPNPTTGIITISMENVQQGSSIQIYDMLGQTVFQFIINATRSEVNMSGKPAGTYLYHISGANGDNISGGTFILQ
jgi:hypothetical protein